MEKYNPFSNIFPGWDPYLEVDHRGSNERYFLLFCDLGDLFMANPWLEFFGVNVLTKNERDQSALILACYGDEENRVELVEWLLEHEEMLACIDDVDKEGRSALHWAELHGNRAVVRVLLSFGADRTTRDEAGLTAADCLQRLFPNTKERELAQLIERAHIPPKEEWRPRIASEFPSVFRDALQSLLILAKARVL
jgi:hypothetical protein